MESESINNWKNGTTGEELVDEAIFSLRKDGNITYGNRKLLASYFTQQISPNWLVGASFFEEHLLDYAPASNYGYWSHIAGVGTSDKENTANKWQDLAKKLETHKL